MEANRIKIIITYEGRSVAFSTDPLSDLNATIQNIISIAKSNPQKYWELPERRWQLDQGFYLAKTDENGKQILLRPYTNEQSLCLSDYDVKERDALIFGL